MEDTHYVTRLNGALFGAVYDGHKGHEAAEYAKNNLHRYFFREFGSKDDPSAAFRAAYQHVDRDLRHTLSGTTAVTFYMNNKVIWWADVGDSILVVVRRDGSAEQLSVIHDIDNPDERERVEAEGGVVMRPYVMKGAQGIAPTRALGDSYFRDIGVISEPATGTYSVTPDDQWLIAATDGLSDVMTIRELGVFLVRYDDAETAAEALRGEALENRHTKDNTTFILTLLAGK